MFALAYDIGTDKWTVGYIVGLGELTSFQAVYVNDVDALGSPQIEDLEINTYLGTTTQGLDPFLNAAFASFSDNMRITDPAAAGGEIGIAYVVIRYPSTLYSTIPEVIAEVQGRKVFNPGSSPEMVYSENPALHLGDYMASSVYGAGRTNDNTSLAALRDVCDDTTATSPQETLRQSGLVMDQAQPIGTWIEILREYAGAWIVERGGTVYYTADAAGSSVMTINESDIIKGSFTAKLRDRGEAPTVIRATWTDKTNNKWRSAAADMAKAAGVDAGTTPWRESQINLEGVDRHSQAYRMSVTRLNKFQLDTEYEWEQFDEALELELGDIVTISHPLLGSPNNKLVRLIDDPRQDRPGRWKLRAEEYLSSVYDGSVLPATIGNDGVLPNGGKPTPPSGLTVTSVQFQTADGFWRSRFKISWTAPADGSLVTHYYIKVEQGDVSPIAPIWDTTIPSTQTETATAALEEGATYTISVASVNGVLRGDFVIDGEPLTANTTGPAEPASLSSSIRNGIVYLSWPASTDSSALYYGIKEGTTGDTWATANDVDLERKALNLTIDMTDDAGSTRRFFVKSFDALGNESTNPRTADYAIPAISSGGVTTFYSASVPTALAAGDLFYKTDDKNHPYRATAAGDNEINVSPEEWVSIRDGTIADAQAAADAAQATADGKVIVYAQDAAPVQTSPETIQEGDLWMDTNSSPLNQMSIWDSATGSWTPLQATTISAAAAAAADAQATADGKIVSFYQASAPVSASHGDIWVDTSAPDNVWRRWSTDISPHAWEPMLDEDDITQAQATANGKNTCYWSTSAPSSPSSYDDGDIWFHTTDDNHEYQLQDLSPGGKTWVSMRDTTLRGKVDLSHVEVITTVQSASFTAVAQNRYPIDTSGGSVTMTLPQNPQAGNRVQFFDTTGDFDVNNFIIAQDTASPQMPILELMEDLTVDVRYFAGELQFIDQTIGWTLA
jgi:hypothetical protein